MIKVMIINETDVPMEYIAKTMAQIQRDNVGDTNYYGKIDIYRFISNYDNKAYVCQIRYLKRYVEWRFYSNESIYKRK